jgi:hypothetical protein
MDPCTRAKIVPCSKTAVNSICNLGYYESLANFIVHIYRPVHSKRWVSILSLKIKRHTNYFKTEPSDQVNQLLIWRLDWTCDFKLFKYAAISYWLETKTVLIPLNKTGSYKSGGTSLSRGHFQEYPTITLSRYGEYRGNQQYLVLVNIADLIYRSWAQSAFSTHCDKLSLELKNMTRPRLLLEWLEFRELSRVDFPRNMLGEADLKWFTEDIVPKWTRKWTADELVQGVTDMPLPDEGQKIPFLELVKDAVADHTKDRFIHDRERWIHLTSAGLSEIQKALDNFNTSCDRKWSTPKAPTRKSSRLEDRLNI